MSHVLSSCPRSSQLYIPPRCFHQPHTQLSRRTTSRLSFLLSLSHTKGGHTSHSIFRNPSFRTGHRSTPPPHSQNYRNPSSLHPLETPRPCPFNRDVHEALQIPEASGHQPKFLPTSKLPPNSSRHLSVPRDVDSAANHSQLLHARRSHVLPPLPHSGPLHELRPAANPLLQPYCPTRIPLHQPFSLSIHLYLSDSRPHTPLHPRISPRRQLRPASRCPLVVKDSLHLSSIPLSVRNSPGILGPLPLHSHTAWPPSKTPSSPPCHPLSHLKSSPPSPLSPLESTILSTPKSAAGSKRVRQRTRTPNSGVILHDTRLPGTSTGNLPSPTPPRSSYSPLGLQRPLYLHSSRPHSPDLRPRRLRQNSIQQARTQMGHPKSLGQPPDFCPPKRSNTTTSRLRVPSQSPPTFPPPPPPTLAAIPPLLFPSPIHTHHPSPCPTTSNPFSNTPRQRPILPSVYRGPIAFTIPPFHPYNKPFTIPLPCGKQLRRLLNATKRLLPASSKETTPLSSLVPSLFLREGTSCFTLPALTSNPPLPIPPLLHSLLSHMLVLRNRLLPGFAPQPALLSFSKSFLTTNQLLPLPLPLKALFIITPQLLSLYHHETSPLPPQQLHDNYHNSLHPDQFHLHWTLTSISVSSPTPFLPFDLPHPPPPSLSTQPPPTPPFPSPQPTLITPSADA
ncbi:movement protein [Tomato yellow blotch virus]|nr:movement protein [Tomato yellow blotch virus]